MKSFRNLFLVLMVLLALFPRPAAARDVQFVEHCEEWPLAYLDCITYGLAWVTVGTDGDDRLIGYEHDDILRSGKGSDFVNGKGGYDVCYVQPADTVRNCEEEI